MLYNLDRLRTFTPDCILGLFLESWFSFLHVVLRFLMFLESFLMSIRWRLQWCLQWCPQWRPSSRHSWTWRLSFAKKKTRTIWKKLIQIYINYLIIICHWTVKPQSNLRTIWVVYQLNNDTTFLRKNSYSKTNEGIWNFL